MKPNKKMNTSHHISRGRGLMAALMSVLLTLSCLTAPLTVRAETNMSAVSLSFTDPQGTDLHIPQGEVVAELLGGISSAEMAYLNAQSRYTFTVSQVPANTLYAHVQEDHVIAVAHVYSYVTEEGVTVTWTPLFAENLTRPSGDMAFFDYVDELDFYRCQLQGSKDDVIQIYYTASFRISDSTALDMVNEAPLAAAGLLATMTAYEDKLAAWTAQKEAYDAYLISYRQWEDATQAYEDYVKAQKAYDDWQVLKAAMDAYLEQKAAFELWKKYEEDLAAYEAYMDLVNATPELKAEYEANMTTVLAQLAVMDRMFITSDISGYSFAGVLNSGPANYIIENRTLLLQIQGVREEDVNTAVKATRALQTLVPVYEALTDREEKYVYYMTHGEEMVTHMEDLYDSIVSLGQIEYVFKEIQDRGGLEAYLQFLANLYVQSRLMDDALTLDDTVEHHGYPLSEIIEPDLLMSDTNQMTPLDAYPHPPTTSEDVDEVPYPGDPPPKAEDPGEAPQPLPEEPDQPDPVSPAGDPPAAVAVPDEAPIPPEMTDVEDALLQEARAGGVKERQTQDLLSGGSFSLMTVRETKIASNKRIKITLMDHLGMTASVNYYTCGSYIKDQLSPPAMTPEDPHMVFVGWSLSPVPLPESTEDVYPTMATPDIVAEMTLYPVYRMYHAAHGEPTCTQDQVCQYCGEIMAEKLGHGHVAETVPPTCTEGGKTVYTCKKCGDTYIADEISPTGHTWSPWETVLAPTEDTEGEKRRECAVCHTVETGRIPALDHVHQYTAETVPPTCTEEGYIRYVCACLDEHRDTYVPATGHSYQDRVISPTCTEDGYTVHACTVCGDTYTDSVVTAEGHHYVSAVTPATCTENGYTIHTCTVCQDTYKDSETNAKGHTPDGEATCVQDSACTACGIILAEKLGHTYRHTVIPPLCTEDGYTLHACTRCGEQYRESESAATGHRFGEWIVDRQPAPETDGHRYAECQVCGYRMDETLPALPPVETDTEPETDTDTQSDTQPVTDPEESTADEPVTEPATEPETDTRSDEETERDPTVGTDQELPSEPTDTDSPPVIGTPEVKWYAKMLGAIGLPTLAVAAGVLLGGGAAGVVILIMRVMRKKRLGK